MPVAPSAISSQSKRKLKAFVFDADNAILESKRTTKYSSPKRTREANKEVADSTGPSSEENCNPFPQTPGDKIAFADLIANPEDALGRVVSATPNEQVEWKHMPGSSDISNSVKAGPRGKKRAYTSSPASSSRPEKSKHFNNGNDPLDLESISRSLRTPKQDDPVLVLWDRYAELHDKADEREPVLPPLPTLSSSPNTPNTLRKSDGLRRAASCGVGWPVSANKRRKASEDAHYRTKGIFAANKSAILGKTSSKHSRVSLLVDSIHQSLATKIVDIPETLPSLSPVPERQAYVHLPPVKSLTAPETTTRLDEKHTYNDVPSDGEHVELSSEFGDMDIDMNDPDLLQALEKVGTNLPLSTDIKHTISHLQEGSQCGRFNAHGGADEFATYLAAQDPSNQLQNLKRMQADPSKTSVKKTHDTLRDSFGEFEDDDALVDELAVLANEVDSQLPMKPQCQPHANSQRRQDLTAGREYVQDEFEDAFDDGDDDNDEIWKEIDGTAAQKLVQDAPPQLQKQNDQRAIKRYLILSSQECFYQTSQGRTMPQKDERTKIHRMVVLRQSWYDTRSTPSSYVHLIGDFDSEGKCVVDDQQNMIILHPDHLISATVVADSFTCTRRATLQDRIKATNPAEAPQVYGHLIHEVFGEALKQNSWELEQLRKIVENLLPTYIEALYEIGTRPQDAIEYVMSKMPELKGWANVFVTSELVADAQIRDRNGVLIPMAINKLLELEEHVWSPMYGLKGNIDATVQVQMQLPGERETRTLTVPLELKTGKRDTNEMHRAQTALYTLLLSDRYDINITSGILYYLETSKTFRVEGIRNEIRHMIIQRNELACYVHDKLALPPMIQKEHLCKKCYAQTSCFTYHKLVENGDKASSGMKDLFDDVVGHLGKPQQKFFKKWDELLTKEERDSMKFRRELWTMLSTEREAVGRCFSDVTIEAGSACENSQGLKINRYGYTFTKNDAKAGFSFSESQITVGEPIVVSDEAGHFALANGYVTAVRPSRITVAVDRRLQNVRQRQPGFNAENNQIFSGLMNITGHKSGSGGSVSAPPTRYRIDKDEFANGMSTARNNILRIMEKGLFKARELRELIIDKRRPLFKHAATAYTLSGPASQQNLNIDQRNAIEKVMSARDYALVLGMPGTGKTTTIAHIIRALVSQGKSVLLTSYTHTAVDNILLKIKDDDIPILRLGAVGKVHPDVQQFADLSGIPKKSIAELEYSWTHSKVVATTCLGINHAIFNHRKFDYCIVDEASQITLPVCLGPIRLGSTFILVGDHYQLPPLVQNKEAQEGGLDISLFKLLSDAQPASVVTLEHQYRMAADIMCLSNTLIYDGRLKCGTDAVASRLLSIPNLNAGLEVHHQSYATGVMVSQSLNTCKLGPTSSCWLRNTLLPENRCVFLNTDTTSAQPNVLGCSEVLTGSGTRITNPTEVVLIAQILTTLVRSGVSPKSIGIITFYRSQLALLKALVKNVAGTAAASEVEMHTADKYQGRDKEVILLSCVRSNNACNVGELLKDWRRMNVALTRARSKLIIVGSARTLGGSRVPVLEGLIRIFTTKHWMINLPVAAEEQHYFEGSGSQNPMQRSSAQRHAGILRGGGSNAVEKPDQRTPLGQRNTNTAGRGKVPTKVVHGTVDVEKLLDKHPIMRNIADELLNVVEVDCEKPEESHL